MPLQLLYYLLIALVGIQVFYFLFYFLRIAFWKPKVGEPTEGISIVVCAHNALDDLKEHLPLWLGQNHPQFEVIVVDDRSSDGTYDFLMAEKIKNPLLKVVVVDQTPGNFNGKKYALTLGIKAAKFDQILLTDADCRPNSEDWARRMGASFDENTQVVLGYSHYERPKAGGLLAMQIAFETLHTGIQYISSALAFRPYMGVGRNLAYRKSFFLSNKGFHGFMDRVGGDDDLFINRYAKKKHTRIMIGEEVLVWSKPAEEWSGYFRQKKRHLYAGRAYAFRDKWRLGIFQGASWLFWPVFALFGLSYEKIDINDYWFMGAAVAVFLRFLIQAVVYSLAAKRFGLKIALWYLPFAEIFYNLFYVIVGLAAQFAKRMKW
jgi:glycosyltransferase involved in cell wall biosynthesis